jgi:hypothetical protein
MAAFNSLILRSSLALLLGCSVLGCSSDDVPPGQLTLLVGQETDAWTTDPPATTVQVDQVQAGVHTTLANVPAPLTTLTLGTTGPENAAVSFEATAVDAQGDTVLHGVSPSLTVQGFAGSAFYVFLGRSGFSRPFGATQYEHHHPLLTVWPQAFLLISGGDTAGSDPTLLDVYDVSVGTLVADAPSLPQAGTSSATAGDSVLLLGDAGGVWFDLIASTYSAAVPPAGLTFAELIGGQTLIAADGTQYMVGATRSAGTPSDKVLQVDPDGTLTALALSEPRFGAAAALVEGSLVVIGGSAAGAGGEVLAPGAAAFTPLSLPADATQGAGLAELTPTSAVLAGGSDPTTNAAEGTRTIDLSCTDSCLATEVSALDLMLPAARAFPLAANRVLVVGEAGDGETHAFSLDVSGASPVSAEQAFRERRSGAAAAQVANGQVAVVGGDDPTSGASVSSVELFFP